MNENRKKILTSICIALTIPLIYLGATSQIITFQETKYVGYQIAYREHYKDTKLTYAHITYKASLFFFLFRVGNHEILDITYSHTPLL